MPSMLHVSDHFILFSFLRGHTHVNKAIKQSKECAEIFTWGYKERAIVHNACLSIIMFEFALFSCNSLMIL